VTLWLTPLKCHVLFEWPLKVYDLEGVLEAAKLESRNRRNNLSSLLFTLPKEDFVQYLHLSRKKKERLTAICQMLK
jgi:hypothetical protein